MISGPAASMSLPKHDTVSDSSHPDPRHLAALPVAALVLVAGVAVTALWWDHDRTSRDDAQARQFVLMADVVARRTEARIEEHRRRLLVIGGEPASQVAPTAAASKAPVEPRPGTLESEADFVRHLPSVSESLARKGVGVGSLEGVDGGLEPSFLLFTPSAAGDGALAIRLKASPLLRTVLEGWEDRITASLVPRAGDPAPSAPSSARDDTSSPRFRRDLPLNVGGDWLLAVRSTPGYDAAAAAAQGRVWAWGVPLSVLLAGVAYALGLRRPRVPVVHARPSPRALADALPASFVMFDRDFVVSYVNARARQVLGITEGGDPDLQWRARIHPQDRTLLAAKPWQVRSGAGPFEVEVRIRDARDEWRRIAIEMTPRRAESGTFEGFSGVFVDVTDRVAAEEAGARSARFLAATIDAIPTPVFVKDARHRFVMLNRAAVDWTGWNVADVIGKTDLDVFPPDVAEALMAFDREALTAGTPVRFERNFPRAADPTCRAVIHEAALTLPDGSPGVVLSVADLSDERRLEARLAENLSFQRAIHESASCAIVSTDGSGFIRSINAGAEHLLAMEREALLGASVTDLVDADALAALGVETGGDALEVFAQLARCVEAGELEERELALVRGDGSIVHVSASLTVMSDPDGGTRGFVLVAHDASSRRQTELAREEARDMLEAVIGALPVAVLAKDEHSRVIFVNDAAVETIGLPREAMLDRTDAEFLPAGRGARFVEEDRTMLAEGGALEREEVFDAGHGEPRWVVRHKRAVTLRDGSRILVVAHVDMTARKAAEREIERQQAFLEAIIDAIPHQIFVKDASHRRLLVNDALAHWLGRPRAELVGGRDEGLLPDGQNHLNMAENDHVLATGEPMFIEGEMVNPAGVRGWWLKSKSRLVLPDGSRYVVGVGMDLTAQRRAAQEVRRQQEFVARVLDSLPSPVYVKDGEQRWMLVNRAFADMLGLQAAEMIGRSDAELRGPSLAADMWAEDAGILEGRRQVSGEQCVKWVDGPARWVLKNKACIEHGDGEVFLVASLVDITDQKRAEHAHERGSRRLQLLNDLSSEAAMRAPLAALAPRVAAGAAALFPLDRVAVAVPDDGGDSLTILEDVPPPDMPSLHGTSGIFGLVPSLVSALAHERTIAIDDVAFDPRTDGMQTALEPLRIRAILAVPVRVGGRLLAVLSIESRMPNHWTAEDHKVLMEVGEALGALLAGQEADARRLQAETALRESEALLRATVWASDLGVWIWHEKDNRVQFSDQYKRQLGYEPDEFPDTYEAWLERVHPDDVADVQARMAAVAAAPDDRYEAEFRLRHRDGSWRYMVSRGQVQRDAAGGVRVVGGHIDVTEFRKAQDALRVHRDELEGLVVERTRELIAAKEAAEAASRAKSDFLANMSHELRTPMHAILSFSKLGLTRVDPKNEPASRIGQYLGRINESGQRLLTLVNDLLDLSRLEAGRMNYSFGRHDLREVVEAAVIELNALANEKGLTIDVHAGFEPEVAWCDPIRIGQVVRNLLGNAIKFTASGRHVTIELATDAGGLPDREGMNPPTSAVCLTVRDEGIGIPQGELEAVFDKFVQSSKTRTGAGGTGLGLAICREIVAQHEGRIWAEANPGGGTAFRVLLPRVQIARAASDDAAVA